MITDIWIYFTHFACIASSHSSRSLKHSFCKRCVPINSSVHLQDGGLFIRVACNTCASSNRELVSALHRYLYPIVYVCVYIYAKCYRVLPFGFTRSYRRDIAPSPLISNDTDEFPFADMAKKRGRILSHEFLPIPKRPR